MRDRHIVWLRPGTPWVRARRSIGAGGDNGGPRVRRKWQRWSWRRNLGGRRWHQRTPSCATLPAIPRRIWRLSSQQYANATRDLLGLSAAPTLSQTTTDGSSAYAFINGADLTVQPGYLFGGLYQTAENIMAQIAPRLSVLAACNNG